MVYGQGYNLPGKVKMQLKPDSIKPLETALMEFKAGGGVGCAFCGSKYTDHQSMLRVAEGNALLNVIIPERCLRCGAVWNNHFRWDFSDLVEVGHPVEPRKEKKSSLPSSVAQKHREPGES